ncbi:MAG: hypothetical protein Q9197_002147 [Variospora fuerteventurae]
MELQITLAAAAAGIVAHHGLFIRGEWHLQGRVVLLTHIALAALAWCIVFGHQTTAISEQIRLCSLALGTYLLSLSSSITTYRLFLHPSRHFPGPKLAAASKLWHVYKCRSSKNFRVLEDVHRKYGQYVRTVTVFHPGVIELLESPKSKTSRTDWYDLLHPRTSTIFTRDETEHPSRRRVWSRALSTKCESKPIADSTGFIDVEFIQAITEYVPRIREQIERLAKVIADHNSKPVLVNDVMSWFAFDSMGEFLFGSSFGMMDSNTWHPAIAQMKGGLELLAPMNDAIWLVRLAIDLFPFLGNVKDWNKTLAFCDNAMRKRMKKPPKDVDIASWFIEEFEDLKTSRNDKDRGDLLSGNTMTAIVAGSDTTRPSLICICYMLAKYPEHAARIYDELVTCDVTDANALATLPHLEAVINESMRLCPPALSVETAFQHPSSFIPERWTSRPELVIDKRAFAPFGVGSRQCVGKNLALTEIRLVVAMLLKRFEVSFPVEQNVDSVIDDMKDQVTAQPGECQLVFTPRER